jgi:hypothetical protein
VTDWDLPTILVQTGGGHGRQLGPEIPQPEQTDRETLPTRLCHRRAGREVLRRCDPARCVTPTPNYCWLIPSFQIFVCDGSIAAVNAVQSFLRPRAAAASALP